MTKSSHRRVKLEASRLLKKHASGAIEQPMSETEIKPGELSRISLGTFKNNVPPKGFTTYLTPDPQDDAIITQITRMEFDDNTYKLVLHIANYGNQTISVEVRQLL